ncbi:MAG TPA: hypothetical protein VLN46_04000, partial [Gillisia sp.]|nr:hypothetical protein [Gillisia sp.]
ATLVFYFYGKVRPQGIRFLKGSKMTGLITTLIVVVGIGALMFWQFSQPPYLRKASMNTELVEELNGELEKMDFIKVLNRDVTFSNVELNERSIARFHATILPLNPGISDDELRTQIIDHLKKSLNYKYKEEIYQVFQIDIVRD